MDAVGVIVVFHANQFTVIVTGVGAAKRPLHDSTGNPRAKKVPRRNAQSGAPQPAPHPAGPDPEDSGDGSKVGGTLSAAAADGEAKDRYAASLTDTGAAQPAPHPAGTDPEDSGDGSKVGGTLSAAAAHGEAKGQHAASLADTGAAGGEAKVQPPAVVLPQPATGAGIPPSTAIRVGKVVTSWFDLDEGDDPTGFGVSDPCSRGEPAASSLPLVPSRVLRPCLLGLAMHTGR